MFRNRREIESGLLNKGFRLSEGKHRDFIYWTLEGRKSIVKTMTSHSMRDLSDDLLSQMARQCKLTKARFFDLIECPLSRGDYESQLHANGWC